MTFLSTDKMKLSVLIVSFLLLVSAFTFLPAVGAYSPSSVAKIGSAPASVTGATATIDYPILAGYSVVVIRTISLSNPIGNTPISTFTVSIPKGAVGSGSPNYGTISGSPSATAAVYGTGPWSIIFTGAGSPAVLVPGGATITLAITFTTETTFASTSGVADPYTLSTAVTDTTGASTNLGSITLYETASTSVTVPAASGTLVAGTPFTVKASGTDSGLPLAVTASGTLSNSKGVSATTTLSPSTFTTGSSSQSISVNDTTAEKLTVTVSGSGTMIGTSTGGAITGNTGAMTIVPAAVTAIAVKIVADSITYSPTGANKIFNITSGWGLRPIWGLNSTNDAGNITISTADKYGNAAPYGTAESITVSANTLAGQTTGFSKQSVYQTGGAYPYAPTGGVVPTIAVTILANAASVTLNSSTYFFFGVDYGSSSYLTASSSASGLTTGSSSKVNTYTLNANALALAASSTSPKAGASVTITATITGVQQANVPVNFGNATDTIGLFSNGLTSINSTMTVTSGAASSVVTFTPSTKAGASVTIVGKDALPGTNGKFAYNTATGSVAIGTVAGTATKLAIATYFDSAIHNPSSMTTAKGQLYVDANTTDAYGNPAPVSTATQVTLSTSGGGLSQSIVWIASGQHDTAGSTYVVLFTPASSGTSFTISGSATVGSSVLSGSATVTVVSATPTLTLTSPATITSGVPSTINGTAVVSPGVSVSGAPGYIKGVQYSLNGAANVTVVNGTSSSTKLTFQFTLLLSGANNIIVWTEDSAGNWVSAIAQVPVIAPGLTFTSSGSGLPAQYQFPNGGPQSVSTVFTNNGATSLTIIVIANIFTSPGGLPVTPSPTATATVAAGATATVYNLLNGLPHGTYTVTVNVYSASYVSLSPTYTVTVTV